VLEVVVGVVEQQGLGVVVVEVVVEPLDVVDVPGIAEQPLEESNQAFPDSLQIHSP
jgi:hypothetical protein